MKESSLHNLYSMSLSISRSWTDSQNINHTLYDLVPEYKGILLIYEKIVWIITNVGILETFKEVYELWRG